jgi:hypothetical protein
MTDGDRDVAMAKDINRQVTGICFEREILAKLDELATAHRLSRSRMAMEIFRNAMSMPSMFGLPKGWDHAEH